MFAAISERNRLRFGEEMTPRRALWLARPTAEHHGLNDQRRNDLNAHELAPLRARADELYRAALSNGSDRAQPPRLPGVQGRPT